MENPKEVPTIEKVLESNIEDYQALVNGLVYVETRHQNLLYLKKNKDKIPNLVTHPQIIPYNLK